MRLPGRRGAQRSCVGDAAGTTQPGEGSSRATACQRLDRSSIELGAEYRLFCGHRTFGRHTEDANASHAAAGQL